MPTIVLAIDAYSQLEQLLPAALLLASGQNALLLGVFAQDSRLLQGAALPCTQEIGANSAACFPLTAETMENRVRRIAEDMRRRLAMAAERRKLPWEFQLCYGSISQITTETTADAVLPGWSGHLWISGSHPGPPTRSSAARAAIAVVDDGSLSAAQAVEAARRLTAAAGLPELVILEMDSVPVPGLTGSARSSVGRPPEVRIRVDSPDQLMRHLRVLCPTLMLLGRDQPLASDSRLRKELFLLKCPLALLSATW